MRGRFCKPDKRRKFGYIAAFYTRLASQNRMLPRTDRKTSTGWLGKEKTYEEEAFLRHNQDYFVRCQCRRLTFDFLDRFGLVFAFHCLSQLSTDSSNSTSASSSSWLPGAESRSSKAFLAASVSLWSSWPMSTGSGSRGGVRASATV